MSGRAFKREFSGESIEKKSSKKIIKRICGSKKKQQVSYIKNKDLRRKRLENSKNEETKIRRSQEQANSVQKRMNIAFFKKKKKAHKANRINTKRKEKRNKIERQIKHLTRSYKDKERTRKLLTIICLKFNIDDLGNIRQLKKLL